MASYKMIQQQKSFTLGDGGELFDTALKIHIASYSVASWRIATSVVK